MSHRKLKKNQFNAIREQLLDAANPRSQASLAADYSVTTTMISVVNNARTWGNYLAGKNAKHPLRGPFKAVQPTKPAAAEAAGFRPLTAENRAEKKIEQELKAIEDKFQDENDALHLRGDGALNRIVDVEDESTRNFVTGIIAIFIAVVAFVISIIALVN